MKMKHWYAIQEHWSLVMIRVSINATQDFKTKCDCFDLHLQN